MRLRIAAVSDVAEWQFLKCARALKITRTATSLAGEALGERQRRSQLKHYASGNVT